MQILRSLQFVVGKTNNAILYLMECLYDRIYVLYYVYINVCHPE